MQIIALMLALAVCVVFLTFLVVAYGRLGHRCLTWLPAWAAFGVVSYFGVGTVFLALYPKERWYFLDAERFDYSLALVLLGLVLFTTASVMAAGPRRMRQHLGVPARPDPAMLALLVLVAIMLWLLRIRVGGEAVGLVAGDGTMAGASAVDRLARHGIGLLGSLVLPLAVINSMDGFDPRRRVPAAGVALWTAGLIALGELAFVFVRGSRKEFLSVLVVFAAGYALRIGRWPARRYLLVGLCVAAVGTAFLTMWRYERSDFEGEVSTYLLESSRATFDTWMISDDESSRREALVATGFHRLNAVEIFAAIYERQVDGFPLLSWEAVSTYLATYVPTILWPDKHRHTRLGVEALTKQEYRLPAADQAWTFLCDFLVIGGSLGFLALMALIGATLSRLSAWLHARATTSILHVAITLYLIQVAFMFEGTLDRQFILPLRNVVAWCVMAWIAHLFWPVAPPHPPHHRVDLGATRGRGVR